jgi:hypothetical protein
MHTSVSLKERDYLGKLGVDGRMTKSFPDHWDCWAWTGFIWLWKSAGDSPYVNTVMKSGFIKCGEFLG